MCAVINQCTSMSYDSYESIKACYPVLKQCNSMVYDSHGPNQVCIPELLVQFYRN